MSNNQMPEWAQTIIDNQTALVELVKSMQTELAEVKAEKANLEEENKSSREDDVPDMTDAELDEIAGRGL